MTEAPERYQEALQDLYQRTTQGMKLGLDNTRQLLQLVGSPHHAMKHIVVAGTNGKGSTSSLLATSLQAAGIKVGLYTSPHLLRYTERIKINGQEIEQTKVVELYERIQKVEHQCTAMPTFFEITTVMALLAFNQSNVEIAVLEVGLGGRLDSTNVVDKFLSIITPIHLDHVHILGDTLEKIAAEKAGIIAADTPVLSAAQAPAARQVLETISAQRNAPLHFSHAHTLDSGTLTISNNADENLTVPFQGPPYQASNAATVYSALAILQGMGLAVGSQHLQQALTQWQWPGRFQVIQDAIPVVLDGAHNPHAVEALFKALPTPDERPLHVVFSAIHTKDAGQMIQRLKTLSSTLHLTPSSVGKSLDRTALQTLAPDLPTYPDPLAAFAQARKIAQEDGGHVLVTGSLFLVADLLHYLSGENRDPGIAS